MTITSFAYLLFIAVGALVYYVIPKKLQWLQLLLLSLLFYMVAATPYTLLYLLLSTLLAFISTNLLPCGLFAGKTSKKAITAVTVAAVLANTVIWFLLKGSDYWVLLSEKLVGRLSFVQPLSPLPLAAALGMGYYTLQTIGYIMDCYYGTSLPQKNPLKLFLFVCFFPQLTTGPISRYNALGQLYEGHAFCYDKIAGGAQRILWGLFKKLVIAERVGLIVNGVYGDLDAYTGWWRWIAVLLYPIQMYSDFSGCMDIVLGTAELFGITLPENFNNPFFSRSTQEFWSRWHITLGDWAKNFVLYPMLKRPKMVDFGRRCKKRFGKRVGKLIPTAICMFFLWMVMGVWHGSYKYIVGVSLWYWLILILGEAVGPELKKLTDFLRIPTQSTTWHLFQCARTYLIYAIGAVFFRAQGLGEASAILKSLFQKGVSENAWVFFDGSVLNFGLSYLDLNVLVLSVAALYVVGVLREKYGFARNWVKQQGFVFRWFIWIALFAVVLIFGNYGPDFVASDFIYKGF